MIEIAAQRQLKRLLAEDIGFGDITSQLVGGETGSAYIVAKEACVISGLAYMKYLFEVRGLHIDLYVKDGDTVEKGDKIADISGCYKNIFEVERTALNLLTRMCGITTEVKKLTERVKRVNPGCRVAATRKTVLRFFDKEAVITGGGDSHRFRLDDLILLKDNHVKVLGIEEAIKRAKLSSFSKKVEIEVSTRKDAVTAVTSGADVVMLDNMGVGAVRETVKILKKVNPGVMVEASGGITGENIEEYAEAGVDIISLGYVTHSVRAVDMSLEVDL